MGVGGLRILRVAGIDIKVHASWLIVFSLIAWLFIAVVLPAQFSELGLPATIVTGLLMTVLFFGSIVVHELAHALYAKSKGIRIRQITLFVFGGAAEIEDDPRRARHEFIMAALGPLTSVAIGVGFVAVFLVGVAVDSVALQAVGITLGSVNILLAVFNLLPGLPLDGGRMLKAVAWKLTKSPEKATRIAATSGRALGYLLIAYGIFQFAVFMSIGGVWLILIGFFILRAASASYQTTMIKVKLSGVKVKEIMQKAKLEDEHVLELDAGDTAIRAFSIMQRQGKSVLYVGKNGKPVGLVAAEDIQKLLNNQQ